MSIADDDEAAKGLMSGPQAATIECERTGSTSSACASGNLPVVPSLCDIPPFKTNAQILSELAAKGYVGTDKPESLYVLEHVTYQHLTPYLKALNNMSPHPDPSLKLAHDLLTFDRRMQAMLLKYTGVFEFQLRSQYLSHMAESHGAYAIYDAHLFLRANRHTETLGYYEQEVQKRIRRDSNMRQAYEDGHGKLPLWMGVECMTLGTLSSLFSNTRDRTVTDAVAHSFGASKDELVSWTKTITATRNICAHFEPLFVRKQLPAQPKAIRGLQCPRRSPLFAVLLLAHLLRKTIKTYDRNLDYKSRIEHDAAQEIAALLEYFGNVPIPGIPFNWRTLLNAQ